MTLDEIRKYVNYICVKENTGGTLTPQQINAVFPSANIDLLNKTIEKAQMYALQNKMPFSKAIYEFKSMLKFRVKRNIQLLNVATVLWDGSMLSTNKAGYDTIGVGLNVSNVELPIGTYVTGKSIIGPLRLINLSNDIITTGTTTLAFSSAIYNLDTLGDYAYWLSLMTIYNGTTRSIDIITDGEMDERRSNSLALDLSEYPSAIINSNLIEVLPNNITSAEFTYLKIPAKPVYDYYIDASYNEIYLPAGSTHALTSGQVGSAGQTSGTVTSLTVELEWDLLHHIEFCNEVLKKVAPNLKDDRIAAYASQAAQEQG